MGPDRCVWGAIAVTEKEAKRNKYGYKINIKYCWTWMIYTFLSILFILFEIKIGKCFWNDSPKEGFYSQ